MHSSLSIGILENFGPINRKPHVAEAITQSGSDEVTFRVPKARLYSTYFHENVLGGGQVLPPITGRLSGAGNWVNLHLNYGDQALGEQGRWSISVIIAVRERNDHDQQAPAHHG